MEHNYKSVHSCLNRDEKCLVKGIKANCTILSKRFKDMMVMEFDVCGVFWERNAIMKVYYLLIGIIGLVSIFTINIKNKYNRNKMVISIGCIAIIMVQGLRSFYVGIDLLGSNPNYAAGYIHAFRYAKELSFLAYNNLFQYEIGYSIYSQIISKLNVNDQVYLFIVAMTIIIPIGYTWIKNSKMPGISVFIYITLGFFAFSFSGLRQAIAISIIVFSFNYINQRNFIKFLICLVLAISFHTTAFVFVFAYPLYHIKLNNKHFIIMVPFFILIYLLRSRLYLLFYSLYKGIHGSVENTGAYTMLFVMIGVFILAHIFGPNRKDNIKFNAYKNYLLIAIFIQIFASQSNTIMRIGYYYYVFITLLIPEVIRNQKDKNIQILASIIIVLALLYFFQYTTGSGQMNVSPYYFYWQR